MIFKYIKQMDIEKLVENDRVAWVIYGVQTKDKEEFISNCIVALQNFGFNTNILNQCGVFRENNVYNIVITVKKQCKMTNQDSIALDNWCKSIKNVKTAKEFIKDQYNGKNITERIDNISCSIDTGKKKNNFIAMIRFRLDTNGNINDAIVISPKFKDINGQKLDTTKCNNSIPKLVESLYKIVYRRYKYTISRCTYKMESRLLKYIVVPTQSGIKLDLVV